MRLTYKSKTNKTGKGFLNTAINRLPFEAHVPGYQFCGPGTKLEKRLARGEKGINPLDSACRDHDIAYLKNNDLKSRHKADKILENRAWERVLSGENLKEKAVAYAVMNVMKAKQKMGMGFKKTVVKRNKRKTSKRKSKKNNKRIILCPNQSGGAIPLIPVLAGLSALGSLASGASSVYNTIKNSRKIGRGLYLNSPIGKGLYLNGKGFMVKNKKAIKKKN
jgi:hypothetical protein